MGAGEVARPLSDQEYTELAALRKVIRGEGAVAELDGRYYHGGRPLPHWLEAPMRALVEAERITLAEPDPESCDLRRARLTAGGRARYEDLCTRRGVDPYPQGGVW